MVSMQCEKRKGASMNMPGHRIAACLGKAALKTRALQTLPRRPLTQPEARSVWSASDLSALCARRGTAAVHGPNACANRKMALHELGSRRFTTAAAGTVTRADQTGPFQCCLNGRTTESKRQVSNPTILFTV